MNTRWGVLTLPWAVNWALSLLLLGFVYFETGWATTLALFLTRVGLDLLGTHLHRLYEK